MEDFKNKLKKEGFKFVYEWEDAPGMVYEEHEHQGEVSFYITKGSIEIYLNGRVTKLGAGERFDVPPKSKHSAKVGSDWCVFVVGEMIEGDS